RKAASERICTDQHDRPDGRCVERLTDPDRMAEHDIPLQQFNLITADYPVLESTEASSDPVSDLAAFNELFDRTRAAINRRSRLLRQHDTRPARTTVCHGNYLFKSETFAINNDLVHFLYYDLSPLYDL